MDADTRHNRRNQHLDVSERSSIAALPRSLCGAEGQVRHSDRQHDKGNVEQTDGEEGAIVDGFEPGITFTGMDPMPIADDDDELITVGGPLWDVVKVEAIAPLTLSVEFEDGLSGKVRFEESRLFGVFAKLRDETYFHQVGIAHGAVSWPDEQPDLSPDALYDAIKAHGEWVLR